jgi:pilus assembly protein Flp/PilA
MKNLTSKFVAAIKNLAREEGQDLVEYALVVALIAFAAVAGMGKVSTALNTAFGNIATSITSNT